MFFRSVFTTRDGRQILISIQSDREWATFCREFLGRAELAADEGLSRNVARVRNRERTDAIVAAAFLVVDEVEAKEALLRAEVAFASVNDMAALAVHPHLRRITVETEAGPVSLPAPAPVVVGAARDYGRVPAIGEHAAPDAPAAGRRAS